MHTGDWHYGSLMQPSDNVCFIQEIGTAGFFSIPETVGQFTGLFDKNGKEIYEGDILQNTPREVRYKVYWSKDMHAWFVERINYGSKEPLCCLDDKFEVIGSIYDNP